MKNVHSLNQDDVLSGDPKADEDDLSPSAFGDEVEEPGASKKGGSKLVLFGGIGVAVLMMVFFAWKIFSPHFQGSQQQQPEGFDTLAAAPQQPAPPAPGAPQLLDPAAQPAPAPGLVTHEPALVPAAAPGQPAAATPAAPAPVVQAAPALVQPAMASVAPAPVQPAAPAMQPQPQHVPDNLAQVNARIENLERSIAAIQDMVNKMAANAAAKPAAAAATPRAQAVASSSSVRPARASSRYTSDKAIAKKSNASSAEPSMAAARTEAREEKATPRTESVQRATLKAVLDGRAWFQTKSGDTLTVSVGEEVPGMGVVKSIDTDLGEVRFANGLSIR